MASDLVCATAQQGSTGCTLTNIRQWAADTREALKLAKNETKKILMHLEDQMTITRRHGEAKPVVTAPGAALTMSSQAHFSSQNSEELDAKAHCIVYSICREMLNGHVGTHSTATAQAVFAAKAPKVFGAKSSFRGQKIVILTHHLRDFETNAALKLRYSTPEGPREKLLHGESEAVPYLQLFLVCALTIDDHGAKYTQNCLKAAGCGWEPSSAVSDVDANCLKHGHRTSVGSGNGHRSQHRGSYHLEQEESSEEEAGERHRLGEAEHIQKYPKVLLGFAGRICNTNWSWLRTTGLLLPSWSSTGQHRRLGGTQGGQPLLPEEEERAHAVDVCLAADMEFYSQSLATGKRAGGVLFPEPFALLQGNEQQQNKRETFTNQFTSTEGFLKIRADTEPLKEKLL
ncbi:hypothetical protein Anapl_05360 [Anas platyrhynchos]|uniref:Uncharacterized protein n=1 Tax=Anas platyrhynchos TaxID=8839 RepID=R0LMP4_ANAPL|nr:hypothetical protein Anapl_05360 [Anas platyrhynchos]